jgi:Tol biopolymer transport system component
LADPEHCRSTGAHTARAHGLPWDIWLIATSGGQPTRLTSYFDDDPAAAWSPDGRWLAVFAGESIKFVAADGQTSYCGLDSGGYGGLEWLPA